MTAIQKLQETMVSQTRLYTNEEAYSIINNYLLKRKEKSTDTYNSYVKGFNDFFIATTGKSINTVTWSDILKITYNNALRYQEHLHTKGNCNATINSRIMPIHKLFTILARHNKDVDPEILNLEKAEINPHEINHFGTLSEQEVNLLLDFCESRRYKPQLQQLYFKTLFITMLRQKCVLNLNVSQLSQEEDQSIGKLIYVLKTHQKRKYCTTAIPDDLAKDMLNSANPETGVIFDVNINTLKLTLNKFKVRYAIPAKRRIAFHSLKKAGTNYAYYNSGKDIVATAKASHHSNMEVTYKGYLLQNEGYSEQLSYSLHQSKPDINEVSNLSKEDMLKIIQSGGDALLRQFIALKDKK